MFFEDSSFEENKFNGIINISSLVDGNYQLCAHIETQDGIKGEIIRVNYEYWLQDKTSRWIVLVYMAADNDLSDYGSSHYNYALRDFEKIEYAFKNLCTHINIGTLPRIQFNGHKIMAGLIQKLMHRGR